MISSSVVTLLLFIVYPPTFHSCSFTAGNPMIISQINYLYYSRPCLRLCCRPKLGHFKILNSFFLKIICLLLAVLDLHCCVDFTWSEQGLLSSCARASPCGGFSCWGAQALGAQASAVAAHGLSSCGSQALEHPLGNCGAQA